MVSYKKGDIIKVNFNPTIGREQSGYRPAIVISNSNFFDKTGLLVILPITRTDNGFPLHIPLQETVTDGWVLCEHLKTIDASAKKIKYIESVSDEMIKRIDQYVKAIL